MRPLRNYCKLSIQLGVIVNLKTTGCGVVNGLLRSLEVLGLAGYQRDALPTLIGLLYPMPTVGKVVALWVLPVSRTRPMYQLARNAAFLMSAPQTDE